MLQLHFKASPEFEAAALEGLEAAFGEAAQTVVLRRKGEHGVLVKGESFQSTTPFGERRLSAQRACRQGSGVCWFLYLCE